MYGMLKTRGASWTRWMLWCALSFTLPYARAEVRSWTYVSGSSIDADYVKTTLRDEVVLKRNDGTQITIPLKELSAGDRDYVAMRHPPQLSVEFGDSSKVVTLDSSDRFQNLPAVTQETVSFDVRIKQQDDKDYPYGLTVEFYAIGYQYLDHDKYVLLDKGRMHFELNTTNGRSFSHQTKLMNLPLQFTLDPNRYGLHYSNFLVLVFDQRGEVIAYRSTKKWLYDYIENLRKLPKGAFFAEKCIRVHASGPKANY